MAVNSNDIREMDGFQDDLDLYPDLKSSERGALWGFWSGKAGKSQFPDTIKSMAETINAFNGLDITEHYGYRLTYFMFKYNLTWEEIDKWQDPSNKNHYKIVYETEGKG